MIRNSMVVSVFAILLAADPAATQTEDVKTLLSNVAKAMGAENLKTLRYSGSGSGYAIGRNGEAPVYARVAAYVQELDIPALVSRVQITSEKDGSSVEQNSPWPDAIDYWLTPYGFLQGARMNSAMVESRTVFGEHFRAVTFTLPAGYKVTGFIDDKNMVERVEVSIDAPAGNRSIEASYRDYVDFGGLKFPTLIIQKQSGMLSRILVVSEVKPNAAVTIPANRSGK